MTKFIYFRINPDRTIVLTKEDGSNENNNSQTESQTLTEKTAVNRTGGEDIEEG